jgi:predicted ATP-grasp superfamily ATP-dependent carboligase
VAKSKTIRVTADVQKCINVLKEAVKAVPLGDLKKRAEAALGYLEKTFKGEKQPFRGSKCPVDKLIIKS